MKLRDLLLGKPPETEKFIEWSGASTTHLEPLLVDGKLFFAERTDSSLVGLPSLFRGVQILTDLAGQLPFVAIRGGIHSDAMAKQDPEPVDPQPIIVVKPSPFHTTQEFVRRTVGSLIWRGNAYWWLTGHDDMGRPTVAVPISPDEVTVNFKPEDQRNLIKNYEWRGQKMTEGVDLLHIMMEPLVGGAKGVGPIDAARMNLNFILDAEKFGGEFFGGSATPTGVLDHPGRLDKEEADALRAQWEVQHAGGRGTAVLSGGMSFMPISITPEQAQFIATRAFGNQQIATLLGIPQHLLNAGQPQGTASSLTYANLSMVMEELYRMTISPVYLARIESAYRRILPRGQSVRFDTTDLLRTDDQTRWTSQATALEAGILTLDEVRELEGREPIPEEEQQDDTEDGDLPPFASDGDPGNGERDSEGVAVRSVSTEE